jgi:hypothetical protein
VGPIAASDACCLDSGASTLTGSVDTSSVGSKSVTFKAVDCSGNHVEQTCSYSVIYCWNGFFQPVDNAPVFNRVKAGSAIPIKFNLCGNQGLNILQAGYPKSSPVAPNNAAPVDDIETIATAGNSSLNYDATADQYIYVWKTDKTWAGTCRQLNVMLADGTSHYVYFTFTK